MGTASATKYLKQSGGTLTEQAALTTSAGAGDADRIPALNASGVLDDSIINASASVAANKVAKLNASGVLAVSLFQGITSSAGAGDSSKTPVLDASGRLDSSFMPVGISADTAAIAASEALSGGDFVNVWNSTGIKVRKADASSSGKTADGFILSAVASGATATVYFDGTNTAVTGATIGVVYLSATTAGGFTSTAPSTASQTVQRVGIATSATAIRFAPQPAIILA